MRAVRSGHFAAQPRRGEDLARIAEASRVERVAYALHQREIVRAEHPRHVAVLVGADAVLASQRSAGLDTVGEDFRRDFDRLVRLPWYPLVVADQRMQIAVAGVKHVADRQTRSPFEIADAREHLR